MADQKEFDNLVAKAGVKALHTKEPFQKICRLLGIAFATKESKAGLINMIIAMLEREIEANKKAAAEFLRDVLK